MKGTCLDITFSI